MIIKLWFEEYLNSDMENSEIDICIALSEVIMIVGAKGKENKWITLYMLLAEKYAK